jgi:uncharacterized BrkB/YihY/UPF0761 family membrane protein
MLVDSRWRILGENMVIALSLIALYYALASVSCAWFRFLGGTLVAIGCMLLEKTLCKRRGGHALSDKPAVAKAAALAFSAALCFGGAIALVPLRLGVVLLVITIVLHDRAGRLYYPEWPQCIMRCLNSPQ